MTSTPSTQRAGKRSFNRAVISEEVAVVYSGGGRRFFTLKAACRNAAKKYLRDLIRYEGEDGIPAEMHHRETTRMADQLMRGEAMTFDWDEAYDRQRASSTPGTGEAVVVSPEGGL